MSRNLVYLLMYGDVADTVHCQEIVGVYATAEAAETYLSSLPLEIRERQVGSRHTVLDR